MAVSGKSRVFRLILLVTAVCLTVMVGGGLLLSRLFHRAIPEGLRHARVVTGEGALRKRVVYEQPTLLRVTEITHRKQAATGSSEWVVVGEGGAAFLGEDLQARRTVRFSGFLFAPAMAVDADGDGSLEFLSRSTFHSNVVLFDTNGKIRSSTEMPDMVKIAAAGDVDGDGRAEIAVGFGGGTGIHLLNADGKKLWEQPDGNVWHVEMADVDGDGRAEILHSNAGGNLRIRDAAGSLLQDYDLDIYLGDFSLTRWDGEAQAKHLLTVDDGCFYVIGFDGNIATRLPAPGSDRTGDAYGTTVQLRNGTSYFAAVLSYFWDRAALYVYDPEGQLIYHEVLGEKCGAVAAVPSGAAERLLVGCQGKVWEYSPAKTEAAR